MARSQKDMQDEIDRNKERIRAFEEELKQSRSNERSLEDKVQSLKQEIQDLMDKNEDLAKILQEMEGEIKELKNENEVQKGDIKELKDENEVKKAEKQQEDSLLTLGQIGTALQRNMCEYVLGRYFKDWRFYQFKDIQTYIDEIEEPHDKQSSEMQLTKLQTEISWDPHLVKSLKNLNQRRIGIAHPELTREKIEEATKFLSERKELNEDVVKNINKLKGQWEKSESLLRPTSSSGAPVGPWIVPITELLHSTDANGR